MPRDFGNDFFFRENRISEHEFDSVWNVSLFWKHYAKNRKLLFSGIFFFAKKQQKKLFKIIKTRDQVKSSSIVGLLLKIL